MKFTQIRPNRQGIKGIITPSQLGSQFSPCGKLAPIFNHSIVERDDATVSWDPNELMCYMFPTSCGGAFDNLNFSNLICQAKNDKFLPHELIKLAMQLGTPLREFVDMFYIPASDFPALKDAKNGEPLLTYMARTSHKLFL